MEKRFASDVLKSVEQLETRPVISTDQRIQEILFRLGRAQDSEATFTTPIAKKIWAHMRRQLQQADEGKELPKEMALPADVSPEEWRALEIDIETEQIKYGERTPRVETMLASREQMQRSIRRSKEKFQTRWVMVKDEAMTMHEKQESHLFNLLEPIVKDLALELGITRPIELEITRERNLNAFIWGVAKEGGVESSDVPLRVFVSAGAIVELDKLIQATHKKPLSLDHLSIILGHELRHLQQSGYNMDSPPKDPEEAQRYEYDADAAGFEATDRIGRNPRAGLELFQAMKNGQLSDLASYYLTKTHPISENRVKELTMLFHRPDRPFFSADVPMEELPTDVLNEAKWLVRQPFDERSKECKTPADWESFLIDLEADERTTLVDVKMFGEHLKLIVDRMAAMAAAEHEIQTEGLLVKAMLHRANYLWQERDTLKYPEFPWKCIEASFGNLPTHDSEQFYPYQQELIDDPLFVADSPNIYQDGQWVLGAQEDFYRFVLTYGTDFKKVEMPTFASSEELFNPNNSNAQEFWNWILKHNHGQPSATAEERVALARKNYQIHLANSLVRSASSGAELLPSALKENESTFKQLSEETIKMESAVSAFPKGMSLESAIARVSDRVRGNIGRSSVPEKQPDLVLQIPEKPREYPAHLSVQLPCLHIPQERFPVERITATVDVPATLSTYDRLIWRYLRLARRSLDTHFSTDNVREHFGVDAVTTGEVKDKLFRELFYDYMVNELQITRDADGAVTKIDHLSTAPKFSQETLNRSQGYAAAVSLLPFVSIKSPYQDTTSTVEGEYLSYEVGRAEGLDSLDGVLSRFDLINFLMHDPRYGSRYSSFIGNNTIDESWSTGDTKPDDVVARGHNLTDVKRHLFKMLLDLSISSTAGTAASSSQRARLFRSSLKERAATQGVPVEAVGVATGLRSLFHSKLRPEERESLVRFWMQEYFNTVAESPEEMNQAAHQLGSWEALL